MNWRQPNGQGQTVSCTRSCPYAVTTANQRRYTDLVGRSPAGVLVTIGNMKTVKIDASCWEKFGCTLPSKGDVIPIIIKPTDAPWSKTNPRYEMEFRVTVIRNGIVYGKPVGAITRSTPPPPLD